MATRMLIVAGAVAAVSLSQAGSSRSGQEARRLLATDIPAAEVQASCSRRRSAIADRLIIAAIDMGTFYNVWALVPCCAVHAFSTPSRWAPSLAPSTTSTSLSRSTFYIIFRGTGTLLCTGGTVTNARPAPKDSEIVTMAGRRGPSSMPGHVFDKPAQSRRKVNFSPADVVVIPPGVYHGFDEVPEGGIFRLPGRAARSEQGPARGLRAPFRHQGVG